MDVYVGLDVSLKETSICVVDGSGKIVCEGAVLSEPLALAEFLAPVGKLDRRAHRGTCERTEQGADAHDGVTVVGQDDVARPDAGLFGKTAAIDHQHEYATGRIQLGGSREGRRRIQAFDAEHRRRRARGRLLLGAAGDAP